MSPEELRHWGSDVRTCPACKSRTRKPLAIACGIYLVAMIAVIAFISAMGGWDSILVVLCYLGFAVLGGRFIGQCVDRYLEIDHVAAQRSLEVS